MRGGSEERRQAGGCFLFSSYLDKARHHGDTHTLLVCLPVFVGTQVIWCLMGTHCKVRTSEMFKCSDWVLELRS